MAQKVVAVVRNGEQNAVTGSDCCGASGGEGYRSIVGYEVVKILPVCWLE